MDIPGQSQAEIDDLIRRLQADRNAPVGNPQGVEARNARIDRLIDNLRAPGNRSAAVKEAREFLEGA